MAGVAEGSVPVMYIRDVDARIKRQFKAMCASEEVSMNSTISVIMAAMVEARESGSDFIQVSDIMERARDFRG